MPNTNGPKVVIVNTPTPAPSLPSVRLVTAPPETESEMILRDYVEGAPASAPESAALSDEAAEGFDLSAAVPYVAVGCGALLIVVAVTALIRSRQRKRQLDKADSLKPLTVKEAEALSAARTISWINRNFRFSRVPFDLNPGYRERLEPSGKWSRVNMDLRRIPTFVAVLLRPQQAPWRVWILADDEAGKYMWCGQGETPLQPMDEVLKLALRHHCSTVFCFRHQPSGRLEPTPSDQREAEQLNRQGTAAGLNTVSLLVSQGSFLTVAYAFASDYAAPGCRVEDILAESRASAQANRRLRLELRGLERDSVRLS